MATAADGGCCGLFDGECEMTTSERKPKFQRGDHVQKNKGAHWSGYVCGEYSTDLTPEGYAVESRSHPGSVQIYPVDALTLVMRRDAFS